MRRLEGKLRGICQVTVFHDSVTVEYPANVEEGEQKAFALLEELLEGKFQKDADTYVIVLDSHIRLGVFFEEADFPLEFAPYPLKPLLRDVALLTDKTQQALIAPSFLEFPEKEQQDTSPQLHAFFSFKGGVGRTMILTALVQHYAAHMPSTLQKPKILLIDADTEAPGIT